MTARELADYLEVSMRTIYRDIDALSQMKVPIFVSEGIYGGYEIAPSYFMPTLSLNESEVLCLNLLLKSAHQLNLSDFTQDIQVLKHKLINACENKVNQCLGHVTVNIQSIYPKPIAKGILTAVLEALEKNQIIEIEYYTPLEGKSQLRKASPLHLFYDEGCWYLDAYCHLRNAKRTFRLDRIHSITIQDDKVNEALASAYKEKVYDDPSERFVFQIEKKLFHLIESDAAMTSAEIISEMEMDYMVSVVTNRWPYFERLAFRNVDHVTFYEPINFIETLQSKSKKLLEKTKEH